MLSFFVVVALALLAFLAYLRFHSAVALVVALLPSYLLRFTVLGIPTTFLESSIAVVALAGLIQRTTRHQWHRAWRKLSFSLVLNTSLFVLACVLSTLSSANVRSSLGIFKGWVLFPLLLGWIVYAGKTGNGSKENKDRAAQAGDHIAHALILSGTIVALLGLAQLGHVSRIQSIYEVPASLALYVTPLTVMAAWYAFTNHRRSKLYALLALVMVAALVATQSIGAIVALAGAFGGAGWLWSSAQKRRQLATALISMLAVAGIFLVFSGRLTYFTNAFSNPEKPSSLSVRLQLWSISWQLIHEHPLLGIGLGQFEPAYQQKLHERFTEYEQVSQGRALLRHPTPLKLRGARGYGGQPMGKRPLAEFVFRDPHNWPLSFWLNTGIVGLISFAGLHAWLLWKVMTSYAPRMGGELRVTRYSPALALLSLLLYGLVDTIYWKNDLAALHWVLIAIMLRSIPSPAR